MVVFQPNDWHEGNPHLIIELRGFDFAHHAKTCNDCGMFLKAFGTLNTEWHVHYLTTTKRLDLSNFGKKFNENQFIFKISEFENGTRIKLNFDTDTTQLLDQRLLLCETLEDYESCCIIRDKIKAIS